MLCAGAEAAPLPGPAAPCRSPSPALPVLPLWLGAFPEASASCRAAPPRGGGGGGPAGSTGSGGSVEPPPERASLLQSA
jgi:hypothetical protein